MPKFRLLDHQNKPIKATAISVGGKQVIADKDGVLELSMAQAADLSLHYHVVGEGGAELQPGDLTAAAEASRREAEQRKADADAAEARRIADEQAADSLKLEQAKALAPLTVEEVVKSGYSPENAPVIVERENSIRERMKVLIAGGLDYAAARIQAVREADGLALPSESDLKRMNKAKLTEQAGAEKVSVASDATNAQIVEAILAARVPK